MQKQIEIDGEYGSGGGQILRTAVGLSALTGTACRIFNIRAKRSKPGLREQHLQAIRAVASLCRGALTGDTIGSGKIEFTPRHVQCNDIEITISTAGSVGLVLQALLIAAIPSPGSSLGQEMRIRISGGATFGKWAAPAVYVREVFAPLLAKTGMRVEINIHREGFYPRGGAEVEVRLSGKPETPLRLVECGNICSVKGISVAARMLAGARVAERQAHAAADLLERELRIQAHIQARYDDTLCPGSGIVLWAEREQSVMGASEIGERGKRAEDVGRSAAQELIRELKEGCVDSHAGDQILPYLAFAGGTIAVNHVTDHCRTNAFVIEQFLPVRFVFDGKTVNVESV